MNQPSQPKKRPTGIVIIAVLWTLVSIYNIFVSLNIIIVDLGALPYIPAPSAHEWFRFGVPAEMMIGFFVLAYGFLTLLVVYGLWTARSWSYHFALALPVFIAVLNLASMALYASAPAELGLGENVTGAIPFVVMNIIWLAGVWSYMQKPHVKQYLNVIPTPAPMQIPVPPTVSTLPVPPQPEPVVTSIEKKFCRHCGVENKTDAVFCEKCGRKIA